MVFVRQSHEMAEFVAPIAAFHMYLGSHHVGCDVLSGDAPARSHKLRLNSHRPKDADVKEARRCIRANNINKIGIADKKYVFIGRCQTKSSGVNLRPECRGITVFARQLDLV